MSDLRNLEDRVRKACTLKGSFTLSSGKTSDTYFDKYLFESNPYLLRDVSKALSLMLLERANGHITFDLIAGLEIGGIPLAVVVSQITHIPTLFVRKEAKHYGTCKVAEGPDFAGKKLLVIEDVITTGSQVVKSAKKLEEFGGKVVSVACVILRGQKGREAIKKAGYNFDPLFDFSE